MPQPRVELEHRRAVRASADDIYRLIADARRRSEWMVELTDTHGAQSPVRSGDRFDGDARFLGHTFLGRSEVDDAVPAERVAETVVIGARFTSEWSLHDAGDGRTEVVHRIAIDFPRGPLGWAMRVLLSWRLRWMQRTSLRRLARLVR